MKIKKARIPDLRLAFFTWHNRVEAQHAGHIMEELEEVYFDPDFDREKFFQGGREILDAIAGFWDGLNEDRLDPSGSDDWAVPTVASCSAPRDRGGCPSGACAWPPTIAAAAHRPRAVLRRQRPAVGLLLPQRLRLRRRRLRRAGDAASSTRPATSSARARSPSSSPRRCRPIIPTASRLDPARRRRQDIALEVDDVAGAYRRRPSAAAPSASTPPTLLEDEHGVYEFATIRAYGDTTHTFVNRDRYRGVFAPGYQPLDPDRYSPAHLPPGRPRGHRPHRRQRRGRQDGRVGRVLRERAGLHAARPASTTRTSAPSTRP